MTSKDFYAMVEKFVEITPPPQTKRALTLYTKIRDECARLRWRKEKGYTLPFR